MKIVNMIVEILTAPITLLFRTAGNNKKLSLSLAKPLLVLFISLCIVVLLVLYYYRDFIFAK